METEDESTGYLNFLNDPTAVTNNFLLSNGVELTDSSFPFNENEATNWPSDGIAVLLGSPLITTEDIQYLEDTSNNAEEIEVINTNASFLPLEAGFRKTYVNYAPIVKQDPDGNREIYLTEKDINNDASIIKLYNMDGSVITIDKAILSSLNLTTIKNLEHNNYEALFTTVTAQKCMLCSFLCENEEGIRIHLNENHAKLFLQYKKAKSSISLLKNNNDVRGEYTLFVCSICKLACCNKNELKNHMITAHNLKASNDRPIEKEEKVKETDKNCENKSLKSVSSFLIKQQDKARRKIKCSVHGCVSRFSMDELRLRHEECHVADRQNQFKCTHCNETFSIWRICSNHLWNCHKIDVGLLTCPMCDRFKSNSSMKVLQHMAIHNEEKPFLCSVCLKGFKTLVQLKNHEVTHKKNKEIPNWSAIKQCKVCERYFANAKSLKKHIQSVHENFKPFICNICGHKTARKAMLELHLRQHTGVKPHTCPYCEYRTGDHNCLRKHIMRHIGETKYRCPYCPYTSIQSASYKNHLINRHPGKSGTYSCSYCSYTCINFANYSAHLKKHEAKFNENDEAVNKFNVNCDTNENQGATTEPSKSVVEEETQSCFLNLEQAMEETIDTGGITIPAGLETQNVS